MIYTYGYVGEDPKDLNEWLRDNLAVAIDVRFTGRSRDVRWHWKQLQETLAPRYLHVPEWGNIHYAKHWLPLEAVDIADFDTGLLKVKPMIDKGTNVVLLCMCGNLNRCHRKIVAAKLAEATGEKVEHLGLLSLPPVINPNYNVSFTPKEAADYVAQEVGRRYKRRAIQYHMRQGWLRGQYRVSGRGAEIAKNVLDVFIEKVRERFENAGEYT